MADVGVNSTASYTVGADVVGTVAYQRVKPAWGAAGTATDVDTTAPLPVSGSVGVSGSVTVIAAPAVSGSVTVIGQPAVSGTVTVNGTVTALGVSGSVSVINTVAMTNVSQLFTTAAPAAGSTALIVILKSGPSVTIQGGVSVTIQQGASVSAVVSGSVSVINAVQISGTVTALGVSGTVTANGTVTAIPVNQTTAAPSISATGQVVWLAGGTVTATATVTATVADIGRTAVCMIVTSTVVGVSAAIVLYTVFVGQTLTATSGYVVPAGKTLRLIGMNMVASNSVTTTPITLRMFVFQSTALPTFTSTSPIVAALAVGVLNTTVAPQVASIAGVMAQDIPTGNTVGIGFTALSSTANLVQGVVLGYLFP